jgi:hypothetical protein
MGTVIRRVEHETRSRTNRISSWQVEVGDGQSISLKRTTRLKPEDAPPPAPQAQPSVRRYRVGVIIEVDDWEASLRSTARSCDSTSASSRPATSASLDFLLGPSRNSARERRRTTDHQLGQLRLAASGDNLRSRI